MQFAQGRPVGQILHAIFLVKLAVPKEDARFALVVLAKVLPAAELFAQRGSLARVGRQILTTGVRLGAEEVAVPMRVFLLGLYH